MTIKDQKPDLFEKSVCNIWTDSYIQQQMLLAYLDNGMCKPVDEGGFNS